MTSSFNYRCDRFRQARSCPLGGIKYSALLVLHPAAVAALGAQCRKCSVARRIPLHKRRVQPVQLLERCPTGAFLPLMNSSLCQRSNWYLALFSISGAVLVARQGKNQRGEGAREEETENDRERDKGMIAEGKKKEKPQRKRRGGRRVKAVRGDEEDRNGWGWRGTARRRGKEMRKEQTRENCSEKCIDHCPCLARRVTGLKTGGSRESARPWKEGEAR